MDRSAIRAYMLKLVTPSAVGLSIMSAIIGYVANGLGQAEATKTMIDNLLKLVIESAERVSKAETQATSVEKVQASAALVDALQKQIK